jgi:hypothetical protein
MTDSAGGSGMSALKFMGHAAGVTNIEVAQSLEYNAPHAPSATATAVMETAAWRLRVLHLILTGPAADHEEQRRIAWLRARLDGEKRE